MLSLTNYTTKGFISINKDEIIVDDRSSEKLAMPPKLLIPMAEHPIFPGYSN